MTRTTARSGGSGGSGGARSGRSGGGASDSVDTLVGSAYERKVNDLDPIPERVDTRDRLDALRSLMAKENLDYYVIPSEDAHGSEYVAINDKRREWISGFTGSSGQAIISRNNAYMVTDSRYWVQAQQQLDHNWILIKAGSPEGPKDWAEWLVDRSRDTRIGLDARMISHEKASTLNPLLHTRSSKLVYPPQNMVDLIWAEKPSRSKEPVYVQPYELTGKHASAKLAELREWIRQQPPTLPTFSKMEPKPSQCNLAAELRGDDIPFNPVFHSYLFVSLSQAVLFVEPSKSIGVERQDYNEVWSYLRLKPWGEGKVIITPQTSYAISLILTSMRYTVLPSWIDQAKATQLEKYMGLAYENISAVVLMLATARFVDRETPYLNDSGGQYSDGTCDTTRTVHFGRPTDAQCEAFTRVLQGHIAIDSAFFPEGTSGCSLMDGLNYLHGTGHGVGSFLTVHEGPQGFSSSVPLVQGHVVTNEPGYYKEGQFGVRIESCLVVQRVKTKNQFNGNVWLGFERLTCVPIQTKMVKASMLSKEERDWVKAHNKRCLERLAPYLESDQRALKWLRREANKDIGLASTGPGGISIDWD
ncbi:uncharacterized protein B0H18DRAFT_1083271 [Fomitopsis serialis]|uniref:uncharacterized protein n=1 Tax=Fomitopsis serialis TaxID=139415 RepID=UPI002008E072|nr:uncharacterized protein B0H18DRAFT_1083271 [Neoantrodia serialis]KAH9932540.1 hypothetical protein B0H18DRAFT_1083271 [Neoantrodia serialis]